jgi:4-alpha-glucanotransferase
MSLERSSGILLHPTSLPGPDGIGDLGPEAYRWVDFLAQAECKLWQVLPLGPTGYGDSPYQCFSAFAGNPYLISPILLIEDGLLTLQDLEDRPYFEEETVNFGKVIEWKTTLLNRAYYHFKNSAKAKIKKEFNAFVESHAEWLDNFALFMAIKETQGGVSWSSWPTDLRMHDSAKLNEFVNQNQDAMENQKLRQFLFFKQWLALRKYANSKDIKIIGDIPIFVSFDSADTWSHPDLFFLDDNRKPTVVAGVPPDYFSPTGQLWGNPLYCWDAHLATGYKWWISRIKATLEQVDIIRLDHFRGFAGYWEVKANRPTAEKGKWVKGPGFSFFDAIQKELNDLPIIAEDLGEITPDVIELRDHYNLPGMKILQFGFDDPANPFLPHHYPVNCAAYTGSHDNDTIRGYYENGPEVEKDLIRRYLSRSGDNISWDMIRAIWGSVAAYAIAPLQDFLCLGTEARMNFPGRLGGNWHWRMRSSAMNANLANAIKELNFLYSRLAHGEKKFKKIK